MQKELVEIKKNDGDKSIKVEALKTSYSPFNVYNPPSNSLMSYVIPTPQYQPYHPLPNFPPSFQNHLQPLIYPNHYVTPNQLTQQQFMSPNSSCIQPGLTMASQTVSQPTSTSLIDLL